MIRDLLYLDFGKAASIWSQLEGGLRDRLSVTDDLGKDRSAGVTLRVPGVAEASLGADYIEKRSVLESKTLHHDVLSRIEQALDEGGLVTALERDGPSNPTDPEQIRTIIEARPYLKVEGATVLEDYSRFLAIAERFNDIAAFIGRAAFETLKKSPEYRALEETLQVAKAQAEATKDRNQRAVQKSRVAEIQRSVETKARPDVSGLDTWLLDGVRLWIETFMSGRINFRVFPYRELPSFQVICNLKRECFVDADLSHLLYGYGTRPSVPLEVFGLVTSIPSRSGTEFDPMLEFSQSAELAEKAAFEKGFRTVFDGMEGMESLARFSRYPNVFVHPIAVYRSFSTNAKAR